LRCSNCQRILKRRRAGEEGLSRKYGVTRDRPAIRPKGDNRRSLVEYNTGEESLSNRFREIRKPFAIVAAKFDDGSESCSALDPSKCDSRPVSLR